MPISVTCPKCQAVYRLADEMAGKKLKCQKCQASIAIPQANDDAPPKKAKAGGKLTVVLLLILGLGVCACLPCFAGVGIWYYGMVSPKSAPDRPEPVAAIKFAKDLEENSPAKKESDGGKEIAKKGDGAKDKKAPPLDGKKDGPALDGNKDKGPPPPPPTYVPVGGYLYRAFTFKKGTRIVGDLVWARDQQSFYALTDAGLLQQFNPDTGAVVTEKDYAQKCGNLALSGQGLLLSMLDAQEVWIVDPENLDNVKKKIPVPSLARVTAGIDASYAVASHAAKAGLSVIDLERAAVVKSYPDLDTRHVRASPDGRFVFAQGDAEHLVRFRLDKDQLVQEDAGPRIALNGQSVGISPDSRYVCLAAADGNGKGHPNHPPAKLLATYIYPATDLKRPLCVLNSGPSPQAVAFDPKGGFIVTHNNVKPIMLFMYSGNKKAEFEVPEIKGSDVREFSVSPRGFELLLRTDDRIVHVKFTKK